MQFKATRVINGRKPVHAVYPTTSESDITEIRRITLETGIDILISHYDRESHEITIKNAYLKIEINRVNKNSIRTDGKEYTELGVEGRVLETDSNEPINAYDHTRRQEKIVSLTTKLEHFYQNKPSL